MNEIKQLHRRLTALYTVTTGLILTAVILGVLAVGTREFQKKNLENFQNTLHHRLHLAGPDGERGQADYPRRGQRAASALQGRLDTAHRPPGANRPGH